MAKVARLDDPAILESSARHPRWGRYTYLTAEPLVTALSMDGQSVELIWSDRLGGGREAVQENAFDVIEKLSRQWSADPGGPVPFHGGWIGYLGYELGYLIEPTARRLPVTSVTGGVPQMRMAFYDTVAAIDHISGKAWLTALDFPPEHRLADGRPAQERLARWAGRLLDAEEPPEPPRILETVWRPSCSPAAYRNMVEKGVEYIASGDIFQANLSHRFSSETECSSFDLYRALRASNPSYHSAMLSWGEGAVLSLSPELFLRVRDGNVLTRPIKGTRPRTGDPALDAWNRQALLASEKDLAELTMIIDLERNDLGRVCRPGSVRVQSSRTLEAHPTVFHLVGEVTGRLAEGRTEFDLLRATFPGGSITGAPKVRAMQIIEELEGRARGVYTGAIGWIGIDGSADLNIAIRTVVREHDRVHVQVGAGIVADSSPELEYEETLAKARGLFAGFGSDPSSVESAAALAAAEHREG
jgi:para-aminobenzoate synthetase component 1